MRAGKFLLAPMERGPPSALAEIFNTFCFLYRIPKMAENTSILHFEKPTSFTILIQLRGISLEQYVRVCLSIILTGFSKYNV